MNIEKDLKVVDAWVTAGYGQELSTVFDYLPDEVLSNIWTGMTTADRTTLNMYLSGDIVTALPAVVTIYPQAVVHLKGALATDAQLEAILTDLVYVEWRVVFDDLTAADLGDASILIMVLSDSTLSYTDDELAAIKAWYDGGMLCGYPIIARRPVLSI